ILITGDGVPLDAVVADFMAGAVETITGPNDEDHWDLVEGQGSVFHPSFSGVTMALIHGSAPDALVLCHEPTRTHMRGLPHYPSPQIEDLGAMVLPLAKIVNPECRIIGASINTAALSHEEAKSYLEEMEQRLGMPTVDPFREGAGRLADALMAPAT
ncbi:MAG: NAD-dependent epimerase/dehydratase family protein, partial [Pseudomonadota bacterium]